MKVLVITAQSQGARSNDFCHADEGELAVLPFECDCDRGPDGPCGCRRSFAGEVSHRASTTARVADLPLSRDAFHARVREARRGEGWFRYMSAADVEQWIAQEVDELLRLAARLPEGAVVERRGPRLQVRSGALARRPRTASARRGSEVRRRAPRS